MPDLLLQLLPQFFFLFCLFLCLSFCQVDCFSSFLSCLSVWLLVFMHVCCVEASMHLFFEIGGQVFLRDFTVFGTLGPYFDIPESTIFSSWGGGPCLAFSSFRVWHCLFVFRLGAFMVSMCSHLPQRGIQEQHLISI